MRYSLFYLIVLFVFFSCNNKTEKSFRVENPTNDIRKDEPVIVKRAELVSLIGSVDEIMLPILKTEAGVDIPSQADDLDKDGNWDELFFLLDLKPNEIKTIKVSFIGIDQLPKYPVRSNIRFANMDLPEHKELSDAPRLKSTASENSQKYFQMEGPAWENDKVAFRNYYDARNGFDIFGKKVSYMVLDSVGIIAHSYHVPLHWGMDILKVGNSLGAGALAIEKGNEFYRFHNLEKGNLEIVADGPLRSILRLKFEGWKAGEDVYSMVHEISIWGGAQYYQSKVTISGLKGEEHLITGIVNIDSDSLMVKEPNDQFIILATHDNQAYDGEKLGLGLLIKKDDFIRTNIAPEKGEGIVQTYMAELNIQNDKPVKFYFYSGWELQDKSFADLSYFLKVMKEDAARFANPVLLKK
jgi:hypothetical protein